jgi:hypothetical protein
MKETSAAGDAVSRGGIVPLGPQADVEMKFPPARPGSDMAFSRVSAVAWGAISREQRQITRDKWWLVAIILERFVTRLFSDKLGLLPGWTNFLDYPLLILFGIHVMYSVRYRPFLKATTGFGALVAGLFVVFGISALANLPRLHPGALSLFAIGLLEPLVYMALVYRLAPSREIAGALIKALFFIGWLQIAIVFFMDLPVFLATLNPDYISGTFGGNAYQLTFFLLAWNALILSQPPTARFRALRLAGIVLLQIIIIIIFLLAQFRALMPFAFLTWILTYFLTNRRWSKGLIAAIFGVCIFILLFSWVDILFPNLRWAEVLQLSSRSEETQQSGKVQSMLNFGKLLADQPQVLAVGTGPGTYASRGFRTFSIAGTDDTANQLYRRLFRTDYYETDVANQYVLPLTTSFAFGSATAASPWYSFLSIPAELGMPGLILVLAIYGKAIHICWKLARQSGPVVALARWVLIAMVLLLQMSFLENWLEVSRVTVPVWAIFGFVLAQARLGGDSERVESERPNVAT